MKSTTREILDIGGRAFKVPALEYSDLKEVLGHVTEEQLVSKLNGYLHAHGTNGEARDIVVAVVEEMSKIARKTKDTGEKTKAGKPIMAPAETEQQYVRRAFAEAKLDFDTVEKEVIRRAKGYTTKDAEGKEVKIPALGTDLRKVERVSQPKTLAQKWKDAALQFLTGKKSLDKFVAAFNKKFGETFTLVEGKAKDGAENQEALGWALKRWDDAALAEAAAKLEAQKTKEFAV